METRLNDTYTLLEEIGSGGGGVVYKAYHERLKTYVVVKQIRQRVRGRIEDRAEADILKRMKHTYLPRVYDFLEIDGEIYTVIDFVPGESLDKLVGSEGPIAQKRVLKWAIQLAEALTYLHEQDPPVIHSDIKPANIMLTPDDNICLIDFNISLALDHSMIDSAGISVGYSPPEQYRDVALYRRMKRKQASQPGMSDEETQYSGTTGRTSEMTKPSFTAEQAVGCGVDQRSDIYSLGATLYHLLTGVRPGYDYDEIIPIEQCGPQISDGFCAIIHRMMELDPERRYQNGRELLDALHNIQEMDGELLHWRRTRRMGKLLAAGLFALGAVLMLTGTRVMADEKQADYSRLIAEAGEAIDEGEYDSAQALLEEARAIYPEDMEADRVELTLLYDGGDYEECIQAGQELLDGLPDTSDNAVVIAEICHVMGKAYLETEDYSKALQYLGMALERDESSSLYYRDYAIALTFTDNTEAAVKALQKAVLLGLGEDSVDLVLGSIAYVNDSCEEAVNILQQAIEGAETVSVRRRAVLLCDKAYQELGEEWLDDEIVLLEQELAHYQDPASAADIIGRLADACVRKAESILETGVAGASFSAAAYYRIALDELVSLYESGYVTSTLLENIAILYGNLGETDEARSILSAMTVLYPGSYVPYKRFAYLELQLQEEKETAERDYTAMCSYYEQALALYDEEEADPEMEELAETVREYQ